MTAKSVQKMNQKISISIQGYEGCFHHQVAELLFGKEINLLQRPSFTKVVQDITSGAAQFAIMAKHNSIAGTIPEVDMLLQKHQKKITIIDSIELDIDQNLLTIPETSLDDVRQAHSHPVALRQCSHFFESHPKISAVSGVDTALSVKQMMNKQQKTIASIAGRFAAERYQAQILQANIQDSKENITQFLVIKLKGN